MSAKLKKLCFDFLDMRPILPGTVKGQYSVCGNPNCRCADKKNPIKHGPQNKLSFSLGGKSSTIFIRKADADIAVSMTESFARMRDIQTAILEESVSIYREKGAEAAERDMHAAISHAKSKLAGVEIDTAKLNELEKSRDGWKGKATERAAQSRKDSVTMKNQSTSRDKWKKEAVSLRNEVKQLKKELMTLSDAYSEQSDQFSDLEAALKKRSCGETE